MNILKTFIESQIESGSKEFFITYPDKFIQYVSESKDWKAIRDFEKTIEKWFENNNVPYSEWEEAVKNSPELAQDYRAYIELLLENDCDQYVAKVFERFSGVAVPPFGFSQERWEEMTLRSDKLRMITAYLRCCSPQKREYDTALLKKVQEENPYEQVKNWIGLLQKFIQLEKNVKEDADIGEQLKEIQAYPMFDMDKIGYYMPLATVQSEIVNALCDRGEIQKIADYIREIGEKNIYRYDNRRRLWGHAKYNDKVKTDYLLIAEKLLNRRVMRTEQELKSLVYLYMNSHLRLNIDIMDVVRYVSSKSGDSAMSQESKVSVFFKEYPLDGRLTFIDKMSFSLLVEPLFFCAWTEGTISRVSRSARTNHMRYEQRMFNVSNQWQMDYIYRLDYAHLDDYCTFRIDAVRHNRIFVKDVVICGQEGDMGNNKFLLLPKDIQKQRRETFVKEVIAWLDEIVIKEESDISFWDYHEQKESQRDLHLRYKKKHSTRCTHPEALSNYELREALAVKFAHAVCRASLRNLGMLLQDISGSRFLNGANECRYILTEFVTPRLRRINTEENRELLEEDAKYFFGRDDVSVEQKMEAYFGTILKFLIPLEKLYSYGNEEFKKGFYEHIREYTIPVHCREGELRKPFTKSEKGNQVAPYTTGFSFDYIGDEKVSDGEYFGTIAYIDWKKRTIQISQLQRKEELDDGFARYLRLLYDMNNAGDYKVAFGEFKKITEGYKHIEITQNFAKKIFTFTDTMCAIFRKADYKVSDCYYLLEHMNKIHNNLYTWQEYHEKVVECVKKNAELRNVIELSLKEFNEKLPMQRYPKKWLQEIYDWGFYKYITTKEDFCKQ